MSYEITKVGIPIRELDVTQRFVDIVNLAKNTNSVIIISSPFEESPAGSKILKDVFANSNKILDFNVLDAPEDVVDSNPANFLKHKVTRLLNFLDEQHSVLKFEHVYMFSSGSPHLYDIFTRYIPEYMKLHVVDAKSSFHICGEALSRYLGCDTYEIRNFHSDFLYRFDTVLYSGLSIFGCIDQAYATQNDKPLIDSFFRTMKQYTDEKDVFLLATVHDLGVTIQQFDPNNYRQVLDKYKDMTLTYGIYKSDGV